MRTLAFTLALFVVMTSWGTDTTRQRLDFAKTYFEVGSIFSPGFSGQNQMSSFQHSASISPFLTWGAFHFWGHAEMYVTFPLAQLNIDSDPAGEYELKHYVTTGARFLPWPYQAKKLRPFVGLSWGASDFKQVLEDESAPTFSKNFLFTPEAGLLFGGDQLTFRVAASYYHDNVWNYPISRTEFRTITTPSFSLQLGVLYSFDASKENGDISKNKRWNEYDLLSAPNERSISAIDFFVGMGPSGSYSLNSSQYNQERLPYLDDKKTSNPYFDMAVGFNLNKAGCFVAVSYRNPNYKNEAYGTIQRIEKHGIALEINKYLIDYTGFTPYLGVNLSYDHITYNESGGNGHQETFQFLEPGLTFGWDILPGKTEEFLVLRTNLRWYPFSDFAIDGMKFDFNQLEYNLIQVVFYAARMKRYRA